MRRSATPRWLPDELVTAIELPPGPSRAHACYLKLRDRALLCLRAGLGGLRARHRGTGTIREARIALGGVAHKPWRRPEAEALLAGQAPGAAALRGGGRCSRATVRGHWSTTASRSSWRARAIVVRCAAAQAAGMEARVAVDGADPGSHLRGAGARVSTAAGQGDGYGALRGRASRPRACSTASWCRAHRTGPHPRHRQPRGAAPCRAWWRCSRTRTGRPWRASTCCTRTWTRPAARRSARCTTRRSTPTAQPVALVVAVSFEAARHAARLVAGALRRRAAAQRPAAPGDRGPQAEPAQGRLPGRRPSARGDAGGACDEAPVKIEARYRSPARVSQPDGDACQHGDLGGRGPAHDLRQDAGCAEQPRLPGSRAEAAQAATCMCCVPSSAAPSVRGCGRSTSWCWRRWRR